MPELPEVEAARRRLADWLLGREVTSVRTTGSRLFPEGDAGVAPRVVGRRCTGVDRRGKHLLAAFEGGGALLIHLGMTGRFVRTAEGAPPPPRAHLTLALAGGVSVHALSTRLLGRIVPGEEAALRGSPPWSALGRDPLVDGLSPASLGAALAGTRAPVKSALLDQARVAGIGNIQASEALWRARLAPDSPCHRLDEPALVRLCEGLLGTLRDTLEGLLVADPRYVSEGGPNPFTVYGREGAPCPRCATAIVRTVQGGRATFHCPGCQRRPG